MFFNMAPLYAAQFVHNTASSDNGEIPVSFSLTLSGGFDVAPVYRLALSRLAT